MTGSAHKFMSACFVFVTLCFGALIIYSQPEQWLATSVAFTLLSLGLWYGLKVKRRALTKIVAISEEGISGKNRNAQR
jgi:hypothetical protein